MKRVLVLLPYAGLVLILGALLFRGFRDEGLALEPTPPPPEVNLTDLSAPIPSSHVSGQVVTETGDPVPEAIVLTSLDGELVWTYTDAQGRFELAQVPEGRLVLEIMARKFRSRTFAALAPDDGLKLDLGVPVDPPEDLPEITRGDLEGQILASIRGRGLRDYEVLLMPVAAPDRFGAPVPVRASVGADRSFRFPDLIHGEYRIAVLPPWARGGSWPNLCDSTRRGYVHSPSSGELEVPLATGEIRGRLFDLAGEFLEGGLILVSPEASPGRVWLPAQSDAAGAFVVRDLPPGTYHIEIHAGLARHVQEVPVHAGIISDLDLPPLDV